MHPLPVRRNRYAALPALAALLAAAALLQGCPAIIGAGAIGAYTRSRTGARPARRSRTRASFGAATRIGERFKESAHVNVTVFNRSVLLTGEAWDEPTREESARSPRRYRKRAHPSPTKCRSRACLSHFARERHHADRQGAGRFLNVKEFGPLTSRWSPSQAW